MLLSKTIRDAIISILIGCLIVACSGAQANGDPTAAPTNPVPASATAAAVAPSPTTASTTDTQPTPSPAPQMGLENVPAFSHIFVIILENESFQQITGNSKAPYLNSLATRYATADNYYAVAHPSVPNYLALTSGSTQGVRFDCTSCSYNQQNIVDQLESHGKTWRAYLQDMPTVCSPVVQAGDYVKKHNPFLYYTDITSNPLRCANDVPLTSLDLDLATGNVPNFVWITPNLCNDMHNCGDDVGDKWLSEFVPRILASSAWQNNGVLFILWDEGGSLRDCCGLGSGGHVPALIVAPTVKPGYHSTAQYSHYSWLRTVEDAWGLGYLGNAAAPGVTAMADLFTGH
jgi:acid phosphatase